MGSSVGARQREPNPLLGMGNCGAAPSAIAWFTSSELYRASVSSINVPQCETPRRPRVGDNVLAVRVLATRLIAICSRGNKVELLQRAKVGGSSRIRYTPQRPLPQIRTSYPRLWVVGPRPALPSMR